MNASPTPTKKRSVKKLLTACLSAVVAVALTTVAAAWFAGLWSSPVSFPVATGGNPDLLPMKMWMYRSAFELTGSEKPQWIDLSDDTRLADKNMGYVIPAIVENAEGAVDQFVLKSLHLGRIDNLISLNPDNKIYFCFELSKTVHGQKEFSITLDYANYGEGTEHPNDPRNSILLYDLNKNSINHFTQNGLEYDPAKQDDPENLAFMELLQFSYCVTSTAPPEKDAAILLENDPFAKHGLTFSEQTPIMSDASGTITNLDESKDTYYLYVCITPKLENFGLHEHILEFFAQSYMFFDVTFSFEVH